VNPGASLATRAGDLEIGFDVYPLDGSVATTRLGAGAGLPATRLHLPEGALAATNGFTVNSLVSTNQELAPNPLSKQIGATYFSGAPAPPTPKRVVVGAEAAAAAVPQERDSFVIGHTAAQPSRPAAPPAPARSGIVIGLSHNTPVVESRSPPAAAAAPQRRDLDQGESLLEAQGEDDSCFSKHLRRLSVLPPETNVHFAQVMFVCNCNTATRE